jgi:SAM-dependent methyltransferase
MKGDAASFIGNIPEHYDSGLGPMIFVDYAADIARRAEACGPARVLETAVGTGIVTRKLRDFLPPSVHVTATDLNAPMLEVARTKFKPGEEVDFQPADAAALPFPDGAFDTVVCQFGVMFFPQKAIVKFVACLPPADVTCSVFGTHTSITHSAELCMRPLQASSLLTRLSFTRYRSPITRSTPSRNR